MDHGGDIGGVGLPCVAPDKLSHLDSRLVHPRVTPLGLSTGSAIAAGMDSKAPSLQRDSLCERLTLVVQQPWFNDTYVFCCWVGGLNKCFKQPFVISMAFVFDLAHSSGVHAGLHGLGDLGAPPLVRAR